MKQLRYLFLLVSFAIAFVACKKELSDENGSTPLPPEAQWEFSETDAYNGSIDTAYIEPSGGVQTMTFEGTSTDGTGKIFMQIFGNEITATSYKNPNVFFEYTENGTTTYSNVPSNADAFTVTITTIDSISVTGNFSGLVLNTAGEARTISNGKFTLALTTSTTTPIEPPPVLGICKIRNVGFYDVGSGLPYAAIKGTFNASNQVTNVVVYDSSNQTAINSFNISYGTNRVDIDSEQYFELDPSGRISTFHGYIDANADASNSKVIVTYSFDANNHMVKAEYALQSDPTQTFQQIEYEWTNNNLTKMVITVPGLLEKVEIEYVYDNNAVAKDFLCFFPNYEVTYLQSAIIYGKNSANLLISSKISNYNTSGAIEGTVEASYLNYVTNADGYVESFEIRGTGTVLQPDTKYVLAYKCY